MPHAARQSPLHLPPPSMHSSRSADGSYQAPQWLSAGERSGSLPDVQPKEGSRS